MKSSDSPVGKFWETSTGRPPHLQVSWGNIFSVSEAHVRSYLGEYSACKRGVSRCKLETSTCRGHLQERILLALCSRRSESPTKKPHTHLSNTTALPVLHHLSTCRTCTYPIVQGIEGGAKQDQTQNCPLGHFSGRHPAELISGDQKFSQFSSHITTISLDPISSVGQW